MSLLPASAIVFWFLHQLIQFFAVRSGRHAKIVVRPRVIISANYLRFVYTALIVVALTNWHNGNVSSFASFGGCLSICVGSLLAIWAIITIWDSYTEELEIREGFRKATTGPYTFYRHPMRLGFQVEAFGFCVLGFSALSCVLLFSLIILCFLRGQEEDKMLLSFERADAHQRDGSNRNSGRDEAV
jgi:protein-S-isoprenylcysteine O-methyltransferase Ste14